MSALARPESEEAASGRAVSPIAAAQIAAAVDDGDSDDDFGPRIPASLQKAAAAAAADAASATAGAGDRSAAAAAGLDFGSHLLAGEGAAIAAYVEAGARIPRRGEVGWQSTDIERLESAGFVMSGSRHKRMNDVRIRKENQVYSAEEKRAMALFNADEKAAREARLMDEFRAMLAAGSSGAAGGPAAPPPATAAQK